MVVAEPVDCRDVGAVCGTNARAAMRARDARNHARFHINVLVESDSGGVPNYRPTGA